MKNHSDAQLADTAIQFIRSMLLDAGRMALASRSVVGAHEFKADGTPVTQIDRAIEEMLAGRIRLEFPDHQILAEEGSIGGSNHEWMWIIDPLDGTRAYVSGLPIWGVSVGLLHNGAPIIGAVCLPAVNELYWGDGQSALLNGQRLSPPVLCLDSPHGFLAVPSNCHLEYEISFGRLRSLGSTAAHLIYVARGAAIGALTRRVRIWDLAGVLPIVLPLGIELRYLSGAPIQLGNLLEGQRAPEPILAAPSHVIDQMLTMIRPKSTG
jgi:myo-inositol-1(or 4)-monophosphatase